MTAPVPDESWDTSRGTEYRHRWSMGAGCGGPSSTGGPVQDRVSETVQNQNPRQKANKTQEGSLLLSHARGLPPHKHLLFLERKGHGNWRRAEEAPAVRRRTWHMDPGS